MSSSEEKSLHAPESHLMSLWIPGGPNTVERRCSLYCAAISHISLCPWLPRSISIPPVLTTVECHLRALPSALSTLQCGVEQLWKTHTATLNRTGLAMGWALRHQFNLLYPRLPRPPERRHFIDSKHHLRHLFVTLSLPFFLSLYSFTHTHTTCITRHWQRYAHTLPPA